MGELMDAPNQQAVRPDGSAPWDEGTGGSTQATQKNDKKKADPEPAPAEEEASG